MGVSSSSTSKNKKRGGFQATANSAPSLDDEVVGDDRGDDATVLSDDSANTPDTAEAFACNQVETVAEMHPSSRGWSHTAIGNASTDAETRSPRQRPAHPRSLLTDVLDGGPRSQPNTSRRSSPRSTTSEGEAETTQGRADSPNSPYSSPEDDTGMDRHEMVPAIEFVRGPIASNRWGLDLDSRDFGGAGKARQGSADDRLCLICGTDRLSKSAAFDCGHSYCQICIGMVSEKGLDTACHLCRYRLCTS
jgi:hypothetical protein